MIGSAVVVGGGFILVKLYFEQFGRGAELCIRGKEDGQTIVFVDKTDMWNSNQSERLEEHVLRVLNHEMKHEERLRVFAFGERFDAGFKPRYSACKPPDGTNSWGLFSNPKQLKVQYDTLFIGPLLSELKELKIAQQGACSPIAEAFFDVMSREEIKSQQGPTRVVLISDMAQNTPVYTTFKSQQPACPGVSAKADPDKDNGLIQYFEKRKPEMKLSGASGIVYQVFPEKRSADAGERAKKKWTEVFEMLGISVKWERL